MKVIEATRTRHVVLRLDRGEELPQALARALEEASVKAGWIEGFGTLDAAELAVLDPRHRSYAKARRFESGGDVVSLSGNVSLLDGTTCVRLFATIARETDAGLDIVAGELLWARAFSVEVHVTAFEDAGLSRVADERTGLPALVRPSGVAPGSAGQAAEIRPRSAIDDHSHAGAVPGPAAGAAPRANSPRPADSTLPSIVDMARAALNERPDNAPLAPPRRERPADDPTEMYPEVGDTAIHFHFGECKIISSDGDKIRLQQGKDLRVREVALSALKTELVSEDPETHKRVFRLLRKQ